MGRGFLSGLFWGAVLAAIGLTLASLRAPVVDLALPMPEAGAVEVPEDSEFNRARSDVDPVVPAPETAPGAEVIAPAPPAASPDAPPVAGTDPAAEPSAAAIADGALDAPAPEAAPAPGVNLGQTGAVSPAPVGAVPTPPTTSPAPDALPATAPEPAPGQTGDVAADTQDSQGPVLPAPDAGPGAPQVDLGPGAPPVPPVEGNAGVSLFDGVDAIAVPEPDAPGPLGAPRADVAVDGPALQVNAVAFDWDGTAPLIAVLLIDPGPGRRAEASSLVDFPVPVSVAIDPLAPDATATMTAFRAAGAEVVALAPLPEGATPADVEVAFQSYLGALPRAVAFLDTPEGGIQESRPRATQVAEILAGTGHGLVLYDQGLNTGLQVATQEGVPVARVLRVFDDGLRDVGAMKRFLDQAAFQAGIEEIAIVTGVLRPEALTALAEWALGTRAASVTLAPVSGVLDTTP